MARQGNGERTGWARAALLGVPGGMRTFMPPAALAARGRLADGRGRRALLAAAAGELAGDKHPLILPRVHPGALAARMAGSGVAGQELAGPRGSAAGAATALVSGVVTYRARAVLGRRTGIADAWWGAAEDAVAIALAAAVTHGRAADGPAAMSSAEPGLASASDQPGGSEAVDDDIGPSSQTSPPLSPLGAVWRGLAAGAAGTAAMTVAQTAHRQATGAKPSSLPGEVERRIVEGVLKRRVPRKRRPALNYLVHWIYGSSWGIPYGVIAGSGRGGGGGRPLAGGAALGTGVWGASLVVLPAMRLAPPVWRWSPPEVASDLGAHLVYGLGAAVAFRALR